ncbi:hypothetical protein MIND_01196000 [Mycena indigotica]|uniref:F-box domain-containing protein n=1 Tax=Mycena indigotica TaxID=2126181 RepID=A0A8H6VWQ9_9AGAR|nr:uncharacterized protein MIND_01196000 [Mycena indigotica]KAF7292968.1 hypothetical protein MIND_01196000 [Mycena indigotica]
MLNDDVLALVCLNLTPKEISCVRQVCRAFNYVTRARSLWLTLLRDLFAEGAIIPHFLPKLEQLDASTLERLVFRLSPELEEPERGYPATLAIFHLTLSVTWVRLIAGNWLFVAASNEFESKLSCYDLSDRSASGTANAYLPGRVKTGNVEIQNGEIVLALGLGSQVEAVFVVTLRKHKRKNVLCELARLEGSSHVLMLSGDLIGCAMRDGVSIPHLYRWKDNTIIDIALPPGGLDVPARRSVPHFITIWEKTLVIVRSRCIELYDVGLGLRTISFRKIIETSSISEVELYSPESSRSASLQLIALSASGIDMISLDCLEDDDVHIERYNLVDLPPVPPEPEPEDDFGFILVSSINYPLLYGLRVGASSMRMLWFSAAEASLGLLQIFSKQISPIQGDSNVLLLTDLDDPKAPALYGLSVTDFDDVLGLVVVGNCFGEVAVFDLTANTDSVRYPRLTPDLAVRPGPLPQLLASDIINLTTDECDPSLSHHALNWCQDRLDLSPHWDTTNLADVPFNVWMWHNVPCDHAWLVEHLHGFPGDVLLQARHEDLGDETECLIFRVGRRYLLYYNEEEPRFFSWPLGTTKLEGPLPPDYDAPSAQIPTCDTARTASIMWRRFQCDEEGSTYFPRRNRWQELRERGGRPPCGV